SRLTVASVARHWGAKTNQASRANAVARLHDAEISGISATASSPAAVDNAYTVPSELIATSRAARPGISEMLICQLKPIGSNTTASHLPSMPARLYSIGAPVAPAGGAGKLARNHS